MRPEEIPPIVASHLVKSVDLNHHGTLFAGKMAMWFVEVGFLAARAALDCSAGSLVCLRVQGLDFRQSVPKGSTVVLEGKVAHMGRSSITIDVDASVLGPKRSHQPVTDGYATFVYVEDGRAAAHGVAVDPPLDAEAKRRWGHVESERARSRTS